jgi:acyl carrier protein
VIMPEEQGIEPLGVTLGDQRNFSLVKLTPAHLEGLTHYLPTEELVKGPQAMIIGGEALSYEQLTFWRAYAPDTRLINEYGPTETVVGCCVYEVLKGDPTEGRVPIGRPISNMQMYVLNTRMQPTAIGVVGELYIGGIGVARGYVNRPEETAASFIAHPFSKRGGERLYRTGDLARYLPNGELEYVGRIDQQVKIRGYRIEPAEIEAALKKHSAIQTAVILAREDVPGEKRLVAYVVTHHGESLSGSELRIFLQNYLPVYMLPSVFVLLNVLPLTPNGKIDRQALPNPNETLNAERGASKEARTPLEELLVGIWSDVLGRKQIGIHDNFFELGGHSLLATQLMARVQATLEVEVPLRSVFEAPTVAGLAQRIEQALRKNEGRAMPPLVVMERPEELPLSFAQQRLWFLNQLDPGSTAYLVPRAYRLGGEIDAHSLERGIEELIHRHESLRTTFPKRAGWAVQVIHPAAPHIVSVIDLQTLDHDIREQEARRLTNQDAQHPCDLTRGPLLRTSLLRLGPQEHVLLLTLHHIITDGWSNAIVVHELTTLYQAYVTGQPSPLAPLPIQYADYALWQRAWLQEDVLETQLTYWARRLGGAPAIQLSTDYPYPSVASFRAGGHPFALSADLSQALVSLSRQEGVTLFMLLLAAFQVLFYRYTGQEDIVIGTDSAGRHLVEVEGLIGFFVNVLALRTDLSGKPTFREMLKRVREVTLGAYTHQDTPFDLLVEKLAFDRNLDRMPLVQVLFVLQNTHLEPERSRQREREAEVAQKVAQSSFPHSVEDEETMVKFDAALFMWERDGGLFGTLNYRLDLFKASTIALMTDRFEVLLQSIVKEPDMLIHLLEWISDGERTQQEQNEREQRPELRLHDDDGWLDLSDRSFTRSTDR